MEKEKHVLLNIHKLKIVLQNCLNLKISVLTQVVAASNRSKRRKRWLEGRKVGGGGLWEKGVGRELQERGVGRMLQERGVGRGSWGEEVVGGGCGRGGWKGV
jgi:hypothetical protein